ncbi:general substrate transporter [Zopfia rhizophila CBS 207.26]|uniref:General substrate transporter n=1 Tax=Zopfia rhizophila CBS 207.26 TaxID=1314779 RepID=A0A6A6DC86_9PEZI|nr:general substrate transporter [Zopfia rhizophila CBS 207.26]
MAETTDIWETITASAKHIFRRILHPRRYFLAALCISMGGFLNGYDTGSIGAITEMPSFRSTIAILTPTMRGFTVSFLLLAGTIPSLFAGLLADRFGHLGIVFAGAVFFTAGAALEAGSVNLAMLLVGRGMVGVGEGLYLGNLNVYICEIAPSARRGMLVAMPQLFVTAGTCAGYFTCYGTIKMSGDIEWRLPFIIQVVGGALLAMTCCLLPQSPRWLIVQNQRQAAICNMERLDFAQDEIEHNFLDPTAPVDTLSQAQFSWGAIADIFRKKYRFRTMLALFILGMVQFCGIDGVLYYAPTLFAQAGLSAETASFVASGVSGLLMFGISVPAFLLADRWGRRKIVAFGGIILASCMLVIGSLYASHSVLRNSGVGRWIVIVLIFVFALSYVSTWGIVGKIYASEIQPAQNRATANALAQSLNFFTNFLTAFITPIFFASSPSGPYFLFAGLTTLTLTVLWVYMPETKGRSLESIQEVFHPPVQDFIGNVLSKRSLRHRLLRSDASDGAVHNPRQNITTIEMS